MLLLALLFSLFLLVMLGFYVFVAAPRNRAHQTFAAFVTGLALWTIKDIFLWGFYSNNNTSAAWWASVSFIISLLMQYALVVFAWVFPEDKPVPLKKVAVVFAPGLVLIPAALFGLLWEKVGFVGGKFEIKLTTLAYAFVTYVYGMFCYGFGILYSKYLRYRGTQRGSQIGAILVALIITGVLKTIANIALPYFSNYNFLAVSSVFVLPGVLIYAYAISNFKLFSLQSALDQFRLFPIAYKVAITIALVAIISFTLFQIPIVWWSFTESSGLESWRRYLVFSIISALVPNLLLVFLIVRAISRPLRQITIASVQVAGGAYGTQLDLNSNDEIGLLAESFNEMSRKMAADIEQLRHLNEQLIRTEKLAAVGTLAAGVAHEVNNPLASISSLIQILQTRASDEETKEMLRLIQTQISRITNVTKDMMEFARTRQPARVQMNINKTIEASIRLASFDKAFQKINLKTSFDSNAPHINADANQLQQVFLNLLLNARDAMPEGGELSIKTKYDDDEITIEISDTGIGISPEHRAHIFDPFYTTKPAGKGTGLGLAVCYGIITAHSGRIEVNSNNGRGTVFRIALPAEIKEVEKA
jgi:signal transduction histidine kinase